MMLVAVIDIKIVATTEADLNHLVRNVLKNDFIIFYTITDEQNWNAPASKSNLEHAQRRTMVFGYECIRFSTMDGWSTMNSVLTVENILIYTHEDIRH